jgi:oxygen-independent coproporphyrinogen-3 oxidase
MGASRREGFKSVSVDLIYGLPLQSLDSFAVTIDKVIEAGPDRLSVFNYAHLPQLFKTQRQLDASLLPSAEVKLAILGLTIEKLTAAGYLYIGMDHFARPDDELAVAQREGTLYRNFQGYSTHADCDLVAMGATAISKVGDSYSQNLKTLDDYAARIDKGELAVFRGVELGADDKLRRDVITRLICNFELEYAAIESAYGIDFAKYFADALRALESFARDGLLELGDRGLRVLPRGRLLIRNICMQFDRYLKGGSEQRFSKVI